jgi:eukaryotic-like serine/threonine-protein kinase
MPLPATTDEFVDLVQKSAVVEEKRLSAYLEKLRSNGAVPNDARETATQMVRDGILTNFQAEQLLQGKWKRFTIGKYKVLERLGQGGMGAVYLCEHKLMRRRVAVKVLPEAKAADPSSLERFYREARAVAALDHPNIVRAYDIDQDGKLHFLVMEHVDGASLQEIIKKNGTMEVLRACHYMRQAALGLQHAHDAAGLVHRDIKPGNILVDRNGIVKILDMGLARFFYDDEDILTKKYDENVLGTADYLAPEQATDSHTVDIRADIYSLGATFYFCLTGRTPFQEGTVAQKLIWHQTRLPKPIRSFRPEVPDGVVAVIDKAMSKDPAARYQSPLEMADALSEWTTTPIPPPPENEMPKLSLAAQGGEASSFTATPRPITSAPMSPAPRKNNWQVPTPAPSVQSTPKAAQITPVPPVARPAPAIATAPSPRVVPQQKPPPAVNGLLRPGVAAAVPAAATATAERHVNNELPATTHAARAQKAPGAHKTANALLKRPWLIFLAVALIGLLLLLIGGGVVVVAYFVSPTSNNETTRPPKIYTGTDKNGEPVKFEDFLTTAKVGDTIILQEDVVAGEIQITVKRLKIEGDPSRKITWHYSDKAPVDGKLLTLNNAEDLTLSGVTLDGGGRAKTLINLYARSPGLTLKNLDLKNFKQYGIHINNCEGSADKYIELSNLTFTTAAASQIGLYFDIEKHSQSEFPVDRFFRIRDCKFDGPGQHAKLGENAKVKYIDVKQQPDLQGLLGGK